MQNTIKYKGYYGTVNFDADDMIFYGRLTGISDTITFEGTSVEELEKDFREAVDDYLETCKEIGKEPEKPYSGKFVLRLPSELHASLAATADKKGKSLNSFIVEVCEKTVN